MIGISVQATINDVDELQILAFRRFSFPDETPQKPAAVALQYSDSPPARHCHSTKHVTPIPPTDLPTAGTAHSNLRLASTRLPKPRKLQIGSGLPHLFAVTCWYFFLPPSHLNHYFPPSSGTIANTNPTSIHKTTVAHSCCNTTFSHYTKTLIGTRELAIPHHNRQDDALLQFGMCLLCPSPWPPASRHVVR